MRILLVEDHDDTAAAITRLLERNGYAVLRAATCAQARAFASNGGFDLLLSDLWLPDGNGWSLMSDLRNLCGARGIALSASAYADDHQRSLDAGFISHLNKPVDANVLLRAISDALSATKAPDTDPP